jgi:hypothetical protein
MNTRMIEDFALRYGAKIDLRQGRDSFHTMGGAREYYDTGRSTVDIELPLRNFQHMVDMDSRAEADYREQREERQIRAKYPAVADAYHKYQMMLELCK